MRQGLGDGAYRLQVRAHSLSDLDNEDMTIEIPDDLANRIAPIAAAQRKSVEQLAIEGLRAIENRASSPASILRAIRALPRVSDEAVRDLEESIEAGRLRVIDRGEFDQ
jgi:hypothetical protein